MSQSKGQVYLIRRDRLDLITSISVETEDGRFVRVHKRDKKFEDEFQKCKVGSVVEWESTAHFKVLS